MTTRPLADALTVATTTTAGVMAAADKTKLDGVQAGATVNATDAELRDRATHTGTQLAASISDLPEAVQDIIGAALTAGSGVTVTYDDAAGTITVAATVDNEAVDDRVAALLTAGSNVTLTYDDTAGTLTIAATVDNEAIDDRVAALIQAGSNVTVTYDDTAGTLTIAATVSNEVIDDRVAALLVAGANITLTYDDAANTLTIASTASGAGGHTIQDEGTPLTARTGLNFVGAGVTVADDSANDRTIVTIPGATSSSSGGTSATERLSYVASTDILDTTSFPATTWTDVGPNHSFTVGDAASVVSIAVGGTVLAGGVAGSPLVGARLVIDSAGTPQYVRIAGTSIPSNAYGNVLAGATAINLTGLAAGTHTVKLQVYSHVTVNAFCRAATQPNTESLHVEIVEWGTGSGSSGAMIQISETIVGAGGATDVTFSNIAANYRNLIVTVTGRSVVADTDMPIYMQFNGDTGANYDVENLQANGTTVAASTAIGTDKLSIGNIAGSTAPAGSVGNARIEIFDYSRTQWHKTIVSTAMLKRAASSGNVFAFYQTGQWRSTAAITSLRVFGASNFAEGTVVTLWGVSGEAGSGTAVSPIRMSVHKNNVDQTGLTAGAFNKLTFSTEITDTHGTFDPATSRWTPRKLGSYLIVAALQGNGATVGTYLSVYKNGNRYRDSTLSTNNSAFNLGVTLATVVEVTATTDYFELYHYPGGNTLVTGDPIRTYWQAFEVTVANVAGAGSQGPLTQASTASGQSIASGVDVLINFDTVNRDPEGAITTGAAWKYTCPVDGDYLVNTMLMASTNINDSDLALYRNGVKYRTLDRGNNGAYGDVQGTCSIRCAAGDYLQIYFHQLSGSAKTLLNNAMYNWIDIKRVST